MNKEQVVAIIQSAHQSHQKWVEHGKILIDGFNLDTAEVPVKTIDCKFGMWLDAEGSEMRQFPWYQEIKELHEKTHKSYSILYFESMRKYNPKTRIELIECFEDLENNSNELLIKLEETQKYLKNIFDTEFEEILCKTDHPASQSDVSDEESQENSGKTAVTDLNSEPVQITKEHSNRGNAEMLYIDINDMQQESIPQSIPQSLTASTDPFQQRTYLKQQDIKQLEQEKELTQLELKQLKERKKLIQQGIQQLEQYYLLKNQEIELWQSENNAIETQKLDLSNNKQQQLDQLKKQIQKKQLELDQLEVVDLKLDKMKHETDELEIQQINQIEEQKQIKHADIKQLQKQLDIRHTDLKQLKAQVILVEQDIADLEEQQKGKNEDLVKLAEQLTIKSQQHEQQALEQQKLDQHKLEVQQEKQHELRQLEQQQELVKDEFNAINQEIRDLNQKSTEDKLFKQKEQREIEEQQEIKQQALDKIEKGQQLKKQELEELELKKKETQQSLERMIDDHKQFETNEKADVAEI